LTAWATGTARGANRPSAVKASRDALNDGLGRLYLAMEALAAAHQIDLEEAIAERFNDRARNAPRSPGAHGEIRLPRRTGAQSRRYDEPKWWDRLNALAIEEPGVEPSENSPGIAVIGSEAGS
jgi:hypothetical protein